MTVATSPPGSPPPGATFHEPLSPTRYGHHKQTASVRQLTKFLEEGTEMSQFLKDIARAKSKAKLEKKEERDDVNTKESVYKWLRETSNTNECLNPKGPPVLPSEHLFSAAGSDRGASYRSVSPPRNSPSTYMRPTSNSVTRAGVSGRVVATPASEKKRAGIPYFMTPKGERMFDDDEKEKRSARKWLDFQASGGQQRGQQVSKQRNERATNAGVTCEPLPRLFTRVCGPRLHIASAQRAKREQRSEKLAVFYQRKEGVHDGQAINVENPSETILEEKLRDMSRATVQSAVDELGDESLLQKMDLLPSKKPVFDRLAQPKSVALTKEQREAKSKAERERQIARLQQSLTANQERRLSSLGQPKRVWKKAKDATKENAPISLDALLKRNGGERGEGPGEEEVKVLAESQRKSCERLSGNTPKHWAVKVKVKEKEEPSFGKDVSRIEKVASTPVKGEVKGGVKGFDKKIRELQKGRELKATPPPIKKSMMLLESRQDGFVVVEEDINPFLEKRGVTGLVRKQIEKIVGGCGGGAEEGEKRAFNEALDRIIEIEEIVEAGGAEEELAEEKAILEEFLLTFGGGGEGGGRGGEPPNDCAELPVAEEETELEEELQAVAAQPNASVALSLASEEERDDNEPVQDAEPPTSPLNVSSVALSSASEEEREKGERVQNVDDAEELPPTSKAEEELEEEEKPAEEKAEPLTSFLNDNVDLSSASEEAHEKESSSNLAYQSTSSVEVHGDVNASVSSIDPNLTLETLAEPTPKKKKKKKKGGKNV